MQYRVFLGDSEVCVGVGMVIYGMLKYIVCIIISIIYIQKLIFNNFHIPILHNNYSRKLAFPTSYLVEYEFIDVTNFLYKKTISIFLKEEI